MAKSKSKATVLVAGAAGSMVKVEDRRFDMGEWPIRFEVPRGELSEKWLQYFGAECSRRNWRIVGIGQLERRENSGSITVNTELGNPQLALVWERRRNGPIAVSARSLGSLPLPETQDFFDHVMERCRLGATDRVYRRGSLQYWGLAWRGELWLDDTVRLGPPSQHDETSVAGPRIVHLDAMLDIIDPTDVPHALQQRLEELSAFLSVMMTDDVLVEVHGRAWTSTQGVADCAVRNLGYYETENPTQMPQRGTCHPMPLWPLDRPPAGINGTTNELSLRADVIELWTIYSALPVDRQRQFLQVAAKFQEAMIHWKDRRTLSFALMVIACEGLRQAAEQEILKPLSYHGWTATIASENTSSEYLIIRAEKSGKVHSIALLYTSATANQIYRVLDGQVEHIFINGGLYRVESYAVGISKPVSPIDEFFATLIAWNKEIAPMVADPTVKPKPQIMRRITAETPLDAIWARLEQFGSVHLAAKLVQRRSGAEIGEDALSGKAEGVAFTVRNAADYFRGGSRESLSRKILNLYYGVLALASAEMLASPSGAADLDEIEGFTKGGHGLNTVLSSADDFARLHVHVLNSGFYARWASFLGHDISGYPKQRAKTEGDLQNLPPNTYSTISNLLSAIPELGDVYSTPRRHGLFLSMIRKRAAEPDDLPAVRALTAAT